MKILLVPDSDSWAIGKLAQAKVKHNPHHFINLYYIHPRDAGEKEFQEKFAKYVEEFKPHIIHFEYFRTAAQILEAMPWLTKYKIILTHHNQRKEKALLFKDWNKIGVHTLVTHTEKAKDILVNEGHQKNVVVIKHGIDLDLFEYAEKEPAEFTVGYSGRIVPWKGLKEVAEVCQEENIPLLFMGKMDKAEYWHSIPEKVQNHINLSYMDCADSERPDFYNDISCYVSFSDDNYEEGPLGFFEALACGTPVITTPNGSAAELAENEENALVIPFKDKAALKQQILRLKGDAELRKKLKRNGWETAKNFSEQRMAYNYSKLYYSVWQPELELASIILPTFNRKEQVLEILDSLTKQSHTKIEVVIADDGSDDGLQDAVRLWRDKNQDITIKIVDTGNGEMKKLGHKIYGLAKARNLATIQAEGEVLVFIDSRIKPDPDAITLFVIGVRDQGKEGLIWFFGDKGSHKKTFVENFSAVRRSQFIQFGMFNERINRYGGMSQEVRDRWIKQGGDFMYLDSCTATELLSSKKDTSRRKDIVAMKDLLHRLYS